MNVSLRLRHAFPPLGTYDAGRAPRYSATVAWGRRLEPWLVSAAVLP